ncbi:amino acid transporter AVT1H isoform X2 [Ziziphus jujuba]|uniref:Amino acid transporter AVT1H isoform X2 n=1 Tax=Ziziphus jujuba TaxID=326968 RepID=A0ABM3IQD2_ZIZJJ|nr:amino acid transporter AVT1H isoform X2 [Ziziphus jujuba]
MNSRICKSKCLCSSNCLSHQKNQVTSNESVHGSDLAVQYLSTCNVCVEQNQVCKCDLQTTNVDDDHHHGNQAANCSFTHAVINMIGMLIGLGQLSTPYALQSGGWISAFLLVGLGMVCAYSSHLLGKCLDKNPKARSYSDIGQHAFGRKGRVLTTTFIYIEIFMALVSYTISLHDNIIRAFFGTHLTLAWAKLSTSQLLTVIAVLIALPSLWLRDLSYISLLSFGGILMSIIIFSTVACIAIFGVVKANHRIPALNLHNIPSISGLYIFGYTGHIVFPDLYKAMKDPSKFTRVTIVSFTIVTLLYTLLAFMGAKLFGPEVNPQITLSMPPHLIVTKIALWATVLTPMTKYALEFAPFAIQLENNLLPQSMSSRTKMIIRGSVGSILLLIILILALSVPYFEHVLGLTGSLVSTGVCLILPCVFYIKIYWGQIPKPILVLNLIFIAFGSFLGVFGTISSSKSLIKKFMKAHSA